MVEAAMDNSEEIISVPISRRRCLWLLPGGTVVVATWASEGEAWALFAARAVLTAYRIFRATRTVTRLSRYGRNIIRSARAVRSPRIIRAPRLARGTTTRRYTRVPRPRSYGGKDMTNGERRRHESNVNTSVGKVVDLIETVGDVYNLTSKISLDPVSTRSATEGLAHLMAKWEDNPSVSADPAEARAHVERCEVCNAAFAESVDELEVGWEVASSATITVTAPDTPWPKRTRPGKPHEESQIF